MDLLDYYRDNLSYLRGLSAEFAAEYPKIARRLLLSEFDCMDPYIERLLEGTAYLSAKVEKKLDDGYYPFLESVLSSIAPDALYPVPSGAVLEVFPNTADENVRKGTMLKAGTVFETVITGINTPCRFSCAEDTPLAPFSLTRADYISHDVSGLGIKNNDAESALCLAFSGPGNGALPLTEAVQLYVTLAEADVSLLLRLLAHDTLGVYVKQGDGEYKDVSGVSIDIPMMTGEKLFGIQVKSNPRGLRILQNYLTYPDFFKFFRIRGLDAVSAGQGRLELVFAFRRREPALQALVKTSSIKLNCVPVLNLFSKRSNRINVERDAFEFHLVPDRTSMRDYEVAAVRNVDFYDEKNSLIFSAANFYDLGSEQKKRNFFSARRRRKLIERHSTARSTYSGTEVYLSFGPLEAEAYQFAADLLVTNRDIPLLLQTGAAITSSSLLLLGAAFITLPTRPNYPLAERGDRDDFGRLSHIVMNLSAMLWEEGKRPLEILRNMLRSYPIRPAEEMERAINGITALTSAGDTFRFIRKGAVFYEWGWKIRLILDENAFAGMGFYIFGRIVSEILRSFTPVNTFLEIHLDTLQSGNIAVWKTLENQ
ncbi:type VI secretion system baseplate subunit TssF [Treponema primitia]|uniref:type VI secretion system baseplate subunit TssF n=1 Tax=Treponema primitia TaxID=88058 RepID=UPI00397FE344